MPNPNCNSKVHRRIESSPDPPPSPSPHEQDSLTITDPTGVSKLIDRLVHPAMRCTWKVNTSNAMCYIFDAVNLAIQFKQGMPYDIGAHNFPEYGPESSEDLMEINTVEPGWMPFKPRPYQ